MIVVDKLSPTANAALQLHDAGFIVVLLPALQKGPRSPNWQHYRPKRDELTVKCNDDPPPNLGVLLGAAPDLIDIEIDGPDGEQQIRDLFDGEPPATFIALSRRGPHRFFKYDKRFANLKSSFKVGGLEFRVGNDKACQSLVYGSVDIGGEKDFDRRFKLAPPATLSDTVVNRIIELGAAQPQIDHTPDPWLNLGDALQQVERGKWIAWCALHGLKIRSEHVGDNGALYLHLMPPCPFKDSKDDDGDPAILIGLDGQSRWACRHAKCQGKSIADLLARYADAKPTSERMASTRLDNLLAEPDEPIVPIIDGMLAQGETLQTVAAPKVGKTFYLSQQALCVAGGIPFLGMETLPGNVIIYDLEVHRRTTKRRLRKMVAAMGLSQNVLQRIEIVSRKGIPTTIKDIYNDVATRVAEGDKFSLVTIDPIYKAFPPGTDENDAGEMLKAYYVMEQIATQFNCGVKTCHHSSKGNQSNKSITDRGSGSGVQSRHADNYMSITPHKAVENVFILEGVCRDFVRFEPLCILFDYPLWTIAANVTTDGHKDIALEEFLGVMPPMFAKKTDVQKDARKRLHITKTEFETHLTNALEGGFVEMDKPRNRNQAFKIRLSADGCKKMGIEFEAQQQGATP